MVASFFTAFDPQLKIVVGRDFEFGKMNGFALFVRSRSGCIYRNARRECNGTV